MRSPGATQRARSIERLSSELAGAGYFGNADSVRQEFSAGDVAALWRAPRCADGIAEAMNQLQVAEGLALCEPALAAGARVLLRLSQFFDHR